MDLIEAGGRIEPWEQEGPWIPALARTFAEKVTKEGK